MANAQVESQPEPVRAPHRRPRRARRGVWVIALSLLAVLVLAIASHPWWLAPLVARDLASRSGRAVHFDSIRLGLTTSLKPLAVLRGVRIANAPWADPSVPFAAVDEARFEFAWRRDEGRYIVSRLLLRGGETHLALSTDGRRNWRLHQPEDRGPGHFLFLAFEPHDIHLSFTHPGLGLVFHGAASDAAAAATTSHDGDALTTRVRFDGNVRGVAYKGETLTGPELTFRDTGRWFPLRGGVEVAGVRLDLDGRVADLLRAVMIDADATLAGRSLAALQPILGDRYLSPRAIRASGRLRVEAGRVSLAAAKASVGGTDLTGDLAWSKGDGRKSVQAHLQSDHADAADLLWLTGRDDAASAGRDVAESARAKPPAITTRLSRSVPAPLATAAAAAGPDAFAAARELEAEIAFEARHFHLAAWQQVQSLKLVARLHDRQLAVSDLDVGWADGHSNGRITLDLRQPLAVAEAQVTTRGVRVESLLHAAEARNRITGALAGTFRLKASGADVAALRANASGNAAFSVRGGTISSLLDAELGLEGGKLIRTVLSGAEPLALPCAAADIELRNGHAALRGLVIDSANTRTTGSGVIDLRERTIDLVLTPAPKQSGFLQLSRSIHLHGHLPKPERSLIERVAQPAASGCAGAPS